MTITAENILLIGSVLCLSVCLPVKQVTNSGSPVALPWCGNAFRKRGYRLDFSSQKTAQFIGIVALNIILFSGGMDTRYQDIRPVVRQGVVLATLGVLITALLTGSFIYLLSVLLPGIDISFPVCLLLGSLMSSTDSASVFAILRARGLKLKHNLRPLLELKAAVTTPWPICLP